MFFFLSPLAEAALPLEDYSFVDHLWPDWSPGYDGTWDVARVKESIGDPEHMVAAIGYYRALLRPRAQVPELADEQAAALLPTPKPTLYLHGRDDNCMLLSSISSPARLPGRGLRDGGRRRRRALPPRGAARRGQPAHRRLPHRLTAGGLDGAASSSRRTAVLPPDQQAKPSATSAAATRRARAASSGHPQAAASAGRRDGAAPQRVEQPAPPLAVRPGERALRPRRRAGPPRIGRAASRRRQAQCRRSGHASQRAGPRCTRWRRGRTSTG